MSDPHAVAHAMPAIQPVAAWWVALVPLLPAAGAAVLGLGGAKIQKQFGEKAIGAIACSTVAGSFLVALFAFFTLTGLEPHQRFLLADLFTWINVGSLHVNAAFAVDPLSAVMILVVTGIGGLIHLYATGYMHGEPAFWRFFTYLNLFTFAMLTLVLGDSLLVMFVGWEGVGLCSWGLIGFWYDKSGSVDPGMENSRAGNKAFIVNRVGDFGFVLGMMLLFWTLDAAGHATLTFRELNEHAPALLGGKMFWGVPVATLVTLFLFVGATGKSAQIPLYVWLPDAMAGPTPVSALIHAATMVTAGVYMVGRLHFLFSMAPETLHVIAVIGAATALMAASIALAQNDIKKVLAYSTVSQLGYMFLALGVGAFGAAIFHLMTHAFFKACLFLGSGSIIHALHHEQDMRHMGGLWSKMPQTSKTFLIATLALTGCPFLAGFFSKDEILWQAYSSPHGHILLWAVATTVAGMTAFYMFRQVFMVFFGECRVHHPEKIHESPASMTIPLWVLAVGSILVGYLGIPHAIGGPIGVAHVFNDWLEPVFGAHGPVEGGAHAGPSRLAEEYALMAFSVAVAAGGVFLAYLMYYKKTVRPETFSEAAGGKPYEVVLNKYYVDELYQLVVVNGLLALTNVLSWFDQYVVDGVVNGAAAVTRAWSSITGMFDDTVVDGAVNGVADTTYAVGQRLRWIQTGAITSYLYVIVIGVLGGVFLYWSWASAY